MKLLKARVLLESHNITFIHFVSPLQFYPELKTIQIVGKIRNTGAIFFSHKGSVRTYLINMVLDLSIALSFQRIMVRLIIISKVYIIIPFLTSTVLSTNLCTHTYILPLHASELLLSFSLVSQHYEVSTIIILILQMGK